MNGAVLGDSASVLVTGASGMIGRAVCADLLRQGYRVKALVRRPEVQLTTGVDVICAADVTDASVLRTAMAGVQCAIHLAGRAHVLRERATDPTREFWRTNVDFTRAVAEAATDAGVAQVVLASSVKAVGETSRRPWTELEPPLPMDPYGQSKLEAERVLSTARARGLKVTILRLPLVYGPGMRANMLRLFQAVDRRIPLPFAAVRNERSLLFLGNLTAAVGIAIADPARVNDVYFLSDGAPVSTAQLVRLIADALGRRPTLLPVPSRAFAIAGALADALARTGVRVPFGQADIRRLTGSLVIDSSAFSRASGFVAPFTVEEGIRLTADWYIGRVPGDISSRA